MLGHLQSRVPVPNHLRNPGHIGRDYRSSQCQAFLNYVGQTVPVAILAHNARHGQHRGVLDFLNNLALGAGSYQLHALLEVQARDTRLQGISERTDTDDPATDPPTPFDEDGTGLQQIFKPFFSSRVKGMGLGLSIVKGIIDSHHGTIRECGKFGTGAEFEVFLPVPELT